MGFYLHSSRKKLVIYDSSALEHFSSVCINIYTSINNSPRLQVTHLYYIAKKNLKKKLDFPDMSSYLTYSL